ncbi:hypothetical protein ACFL4D_02510 [Candidatus Margulisiibacteriota bacterium]
MLKRRFLFVCSLVLVFTFSALGVDAPEKPSFDVPDVVIKAQDRSKSDWLQKKRTGTGGS